MEVFIPPYTRNSALKKNGTVLILKKINYYLSCRNCLFDLEYETWKT